MNNEDNPLCMYLVVREKILDTANMGKVCAQVGHAVGYLFLRYAEIKQSKEGYLFKDWMNSGNHRKVVLKANESEWKKLKDEYQNDPNCAFVVDAGYTLLEPGTETVIGFFPMHKSDAPKSIKRLQTLK